MRARIVGGVALGALALTAPLVAQAAQRGGGQAATVTMREFRFEGSKIRDASFGKPSALRPGRTTFTFRNAGDNPHNFVIVRTVQGTRFASPTIDGGKSATLTVNLKPGSYLAVCTVFKGFHQAAGMVKAFSVGRIDENGRWVE